MSSGLSNADFEAGVSAIIYLTNLITSRDTENRVRLSLVTAGESVNVIRSLSDTSSKETLLSVAQSLTYQEGQCDTSGCGSSEHHLEEAFTLLNDSMFDSLNNDTREIVLILTNGGFSVTDEIKQRLDEFKNIGRFVFGVAIGDEVHLETLHALVNDPAYIFTVKFQEPMTNLDVLASEIFYSSCSLSNNF